MKVGVVGLGFMGAAHVSALNDYAHAELAAVASRDARTREGDFTHIGGNLNVGKAQFDFSRVRKYSDWQQVVNDDHLDAISICLPTNFHAEVTLAALSSGKHVICEKPMALNVSDCEAMIEASKKFDRILMIGQVLRFWPEYQALLAFVRDGKYGPVRQATFQRKCGIPDWSNWLQDDAQSGGAVLDLLVHDIDQMLLLFGMPDRVTAKRLGDGDALMASFIYPGGPEIRLHGGWFAAGLPFSMSFQVRCHRGEIELTPDGLMLSDMTGTRNKLSLEPADAYAAEMHYFLDCCRTRSAPTLCPPHDSANAVKVALALKESRSKDGEQIKCSA